MVPRSKRASVLCDSMAGTNLNEALSFCWGHDSHWIFMFLQTQVLQSKSPLQWYLEMGPLQIAGSESRTGTLGRVLMEETRALASSLFIPCIVSFCSSPYKASKKITTCKAGRRPTTGLTYIATPVSGLLPPEVGEINSYCLSHSVHSIFFFVC